MKRIQRIEAAGYSETEARDLAEQGFDARQRTDKEYRAAVVKKAAKLLCSFHDAAAIVDQGPIYILAKPKKRKAYV